MCVYVLLVFVMCILVLSCVYEYTILWNRSADENLRKLSHGFPEQNQEHTYSKPSADENLRKLSHGFPEQNQEHTCSNLRADGNLRKLTENSRTAVRIPWIESRTHLLQLYALTDTYGNCRTDSLNRIKNATTRIDWSVQKMPCTKWSSC